ncbi:hypothetical protein [Nitrososphaera sp.]|uniref:hypothetical protein n=1 Tax=Nitrososphaera sp. TaxID=1971748 RepID=UPI002ED86FE8
MITDATTPDQFRKAVWEYKPTPMEIPTSTKSLAEARETHLIYVSLEGPWFYINGEMALRFKTRGNNWQDLRRALFKFDVDFWESDFEQVVRDMKAQLRAQAEAKNQPIELVAVA